MLKIEHTDVYGFESAIRGMRNPKNSWDKSDSYDGMYSLDEELFNQAKSDGVIPPSAVYTVDFVKNGCAFVIGENDLKLMQTLSKAGNDHGKFLRMINVTVDLTAPLYWWKEFDTYKVGTVANSCSTMHKIHSKEFTLDDFSIEHLQISAMEVFMKVIHWLNEYRERYLESKDKDDWWQMIQLLPSSYNQRRTVQLNYEVLRNMYHARKNHKLDEWHDFCAWCETLPYFKEICIQE